MVASLERVDDSLLICVNEFGVPFSRRVTARLRIRTWVSQQAPWVAPLRAMALAVAVFVAMHASMLAPHFSSPHVYMTSIKGLTSAIADAKPPQAELEAVRRIEFTFQKHDRKCE